MRRAVSEDGTGRRCAVEKSDGTMIALLFASFRPNSLLGGAGGEFRLRAADIDPHARSILFL